MWPFKRKQKKQSTYKQWRVAYTTYDLGKAARAIFDDDFSFLPIMGIPFPKPEPMTKTKLTIEVDRNQQQRLHDTCPELFAAPAKAVRNWVLSSDPKVGTLLSSNWLLCLRVKNATWPLHRHEVEELRNHLTNVLEDV